MRNVAEKIKVVSTIVFLSCLVTFSPADAKQTAGKVDCGGNDSLQAALDKAVDGDVFEVLGECNENCCHQTRQDYIKRPQRRENYGS